uniref:Uncharacterized protein n=1 Tax=Anguilla anguilla TaxID=7936 RepID=A0A0E9PJY5_ANGAN
MLPAWNLHCQKHHYVMEVKENCQSQGKIWKTRSGKVSRKSGQICKANPTYQRKVNLPHLQKGLPDNSEVVHRSTVHCCLHKLFAWKSCQKETFSAIAS